MNSFIVEATEANQSKRKNECRLQNTLMKSLENIAYERAGRSAPHDDTKIFEEITAIKTEMKCAVTAISDEAALIAAKVFDLFEKWSGAEDYQKGDRRVEDGVLYRALQDVPANPTWNPSATPTLWEPVAKPSEDGTLENPITAVAGMMYEKYKYYKEGESVYLCVRDDSTDGSGTILHYLPSALVGHYFEEVAE